MKANHACPCEVSKASSGERQRERERRSQNQSRTVDRAKLVDIIIIMSLS